MTTLSSTQEAILTEASTRSDGKVLPFPASAENVRGGAATKALKSLLEKGFIEELPDDSEEKNYLITEAGRSAISTAPKTETIKVTMVKVPLEDDVISKMKEKIEGEPKNTKSPSGRLGEIVKLMQRPEGATVEEMMDATGWQKHSVRGAISGQIKKKHGYEVDKSLNGNSDIVYTIESEESVDTQEEVTD
ncbi:MAG: DUF3489 domain-containing protein [Proteobacteria bacterium]|nr:DUF3489 domain-containing protein [Pseudomonadota bacterium]MDA1056628.1 DUF3489 domain-containing protein [Pseudomonadota bacterium]